MLKLNHLFCLILICLLKESLEKKLISSALVRNHRIKESLQNAYQVKNANIKSSPIKPGTKAQSFKLWTYFHGLVTYPSTKLPENIPIGFHAFSNHSGFLQCMWSNQQGIIDFINTTAVSNEFRYVFMAYDENAVVTVLTMRSYLVDALSKSGLTSEQQQYFMDRCFFVVTPVSEIGNWIASLLSDWSCSDHGCGFNQLVFHSDNFYPPVHIVKRVDARYDWVFTHQWTPEYPNARLVKNPCFVDETAKINGSVAVIANDISNCSIAKQVDKLQSVGAVGVLVYSKQGQSLQDLNCFGDDCNVAVKIPVASIFYDVDILDTLTSQITVTVAQQTTPSPNFFFTINGRGELVEAGWFLYPSLQFLAWQMQWLIFDNNLQKKIAGLDDYVVPVFNHTAMQGKNGTGNVTVELSNLKQYERMYLDASLGCLSDRDEGCPPWDHVPQLFVCCSESLLCDVELGRWITAFRRGIGHWLTDVSPLLPLLSPSSDASKCSFLMKVDAWWAQPWVVSLSLRFQKPVQKPMVLSPPNTAMLMQKLLKPFSVLRLFEGGIFDQNYNKKYHPIKFQPPAGVVSVYVYAVISGHGSDDNGCGEFCVTSHNFIINEKHTHTKTFSDAGTPLGCADRVPEGVVPNEHGTWLYGRDGWCDGQQVQPWVFGITADITMSSVNSITYSGLFEGKDPNPKENPGLIRLVSYLIFYTYQ